MTDFMPSSFVDHIDCMIKSEDQSIIARSPGSFADSANDAKQIICAAIEQHVHLPRGLCELSLLV